MRFHRNKALIIGGIALGVLIIAALLAVFFLNRKAEREIKYISMGEPTIPTVTMTYHDRQINRLFGYSTEMNIRYMRDNIYILENTYDIPTVIENSEKLPENITLRVYDPLTDNLIQDNKVEGISRDGKNILMNLKIENIIREGQEYMLDLLVDYGSDVQAHYYTRIRRDVTTTLSQQIDALLEYNSAVYDLDNEDSYNLVWRTIESNLNKESNRDFGHVTLFANMNHMRWGKLTPKPITDPFVNVVDVDGELGYFVVTYLAEAFENDRQELYSISEYYRMRVTDSYSYVLNYERNVDEIFVPDETVIATKSADLGIRSTSELECMSSPSGTIDCFVVNGALWAMNTDDKSITRIFSFAEGDDPVRGADMQYDIRIVNMEDSGDVQFLVYGYMGRGMHEGMAGLAMFKYFADRDEVVEEMFVPSDLPHDILKQSVGELCYLNDKGVLYIILNEYLYALNVNTNETMVVADHLTSENYCVSPSAHIIAWQEGGKVNDAESINVWDMEAEKGYVIKAEAGCAVRVFGFLNRDLAYGQGTKGKTYTTADDKEHLLMDQMIVRNDANQETQRKLSAPGFYTGAVPEYNRVIVKRVEPVTVTEEEGAGP
ncbi:MAG: hypothetical protein HUJ75_02280, partial [Parasporobacterium sp.]|nr:hypothetical protein [Parasporobacterium sp.]